MQSGSFWAFREAAEIPDRDDGAPDWRLLSEKVSTRRKGPILCTFCNDPINVGDRYRTVSAMEDGRFVLIQQHTPSCPRFAIKDRAEAADQFERDKALFPPAGDRS